MKPYVDELYKCKSDKINPLFRDRTYLEMLMLNTSDVETFPYPKTYYDLMNMLKHQDFKQYDLVLTGYQVIQKVQNLYNIGNRNPFNPIMIYPKTYDINGYLRVLRIKRPCDTLFFEYERVNPKLSMYLISDFLGSPSVKRIKFHYTKNDDFLSHYSKIKLF